VYDKQTIRGQVWKLVGKSEKIPLADIDDILQAEDREILESHDWTRRRGDALLVTTPVEALTGVTVTHDSKTVLCTSFTAAMIGRFIRVDRAFDYYVILDVDPGVSCTLGDLQGNEVNYAGVSSATATAQVFQYLYTLTSAVERILSVVYSMQLIEVDASFFERLDPYMIANTNYPTHWSQMGRTAADYVQVALWPPTTLSVALRVRFTKQADLSSDSSTPLYEPSLLKWKAAAAAAAYLFARTGDATWSGLVDKYMQFYATAMAEAREADLVKASAPSHITIDNVPILRSDDFALDKDIYFRP
jgi:hypothetical protein